MLTPSSTWRAYYQSLVPPSPTLDPIRGFAGFLASDLDDAAATAQLVCADDLVALVTTGEGQVKILHQFHRDAQTPLEPLGSNETWALLGHGARAMPVTVPVSLLGPHNMHLPAWDDLLNAAAADDLNGVLSSEEISGDLRLLIIVPHFLAVALMEADSDDAAVLCLTAIRVLESFDAAAQASPSDAATPTPDNDRASFIFRYVPNYLWAVANNVLVGHQLNVLTHSRATDWAGTAEIGRLGPTPARVTPPGSAGRHSGRDSSSPPADAAETLSRLGETLQLLRGVADSQAAAASASPKSRFHRFHAFLRNMILAASEPLPHGTMDADGDIITVRSEPVETLTAILDQPSTGAAKQQLDYLLNDVYRCSTAYPMSSCAAIVSGNFRWANIDIPEAWGLLACIPKRLSGAVGPTFLSPSAFHLKATEGTGLSDADVSRATKVSLLVPPDVDTLAKMLATYICTVRICFGDKSPIAVNLTTISEHIRDHEESYTSMAHSDPVFPLKLCLYIEKSVQLFLRECAQTKPGDAPDDRILAFGPLLESIVRGTFTMGNVPPALAAQLHSRSPDLPDTPDEPASKKQRRQQQPRTRGAAVSNAHVMPTWRIPKRQLKALLQAMPEAPLVHGADICVNFHVLGSCHDQCERSSSHQRLELHDPDVKRFDTWIRRFRDSLNKANAKQHPPAAE